MPLRTPEFTEEVPDRCDCTACARTASGTRAARTGRQRCTVRGALVAAVGAAVLVGTGAGPAAAEPAPGRAGWDGSKYWYQDDTGWWRWTSHYDKYRAKSGQTGGGSSSAKQQAGASGGDERTSEPVFRGRQGRDPVDRVYWYQRNGSWWWTGHQDKYERYSGGGGSARPPAGEGGGGGGRTGGSGSSGSSGTPTRYGTEAAIAFAMNHLGDPYVWGGNGPHGWDCSGLVKAAYQSAGISLPRVADDQYRATTPISRSELRRGDLVFWSSDGRASGIHHVAVYLGDGQYLEAPRPGRNVRISSFSHYDPNLYGRVR
ncbi:C40 family peptidase [Streptomyces sp. NPDC001581]|uniref:C40 family peptidase n=1 Tax=Streptomyces sp. NPDC001581 TaxID=3154386 RepID=UPI00331837A4